MAEWQVERQADGTWRLTGTDGTTRVAWAITDAEGAVWVYVGGQVVVIPAESARARPRVHGHATLDAPMPALVTAVLVEPGDEVDAGATLLLLEAMKMELPLKAPAAGRVEAVHCAPGERVAPGRVLVDLVPLRDHAMNATVVELGPRDGLQNEPAPVPAASRDRVRAGARRGGTHTHRGRGLRAPGARAPDGEQRRGLRGAGG